MVDMSKSDQNELPITTFRNTSKQMVDTSKLEYNKLPIVTSRNSKQTVNKSELVHLHNYFENPELSRELLSTPVGTNLAAAYLDSLFTS